MKVTKDIAAAWTVDMEEQELGFQKHVAGYIVSLAAQEQLILKRNKFSLPHGRLQYLRQKQKEISSNSFISMRLGNKPSDEKSHNPS